MDYLVFGKNLYIKNDKNKFYAYNYNNELVNEFRFHETSKKIFLSSSLNDSESIILMSEILYFKGGKNKNVIFRGKKAFDLSKEGFRMINGEYVKDIYCFEKERKTKFKTIDELYMYPQLVPWNLVEREHDVINLVKKYVHKNSNVLEIGSGYGKNLLLLKEIGYENSIGIEYSKNACDLSKKMMTDNYYGDITSTNFSNEQFDAVIDIGCLHCIGSRNRALKEVSRILKSNGLIISRYFLPKDKKWLDRFPLEVSSFGADYEELLSSFSDYNILESYIENECIYIVGRKI